MCPFCLIELPKRADFVHECTFGTETCHLERDGVYEFLYFLDAQPRPFKHRDLNRYVKRFRQN